MCCSFLALVPFPFSLCIGLIKRLSARRLTTWSTSPPPSRASRRRTSWTASMMAVTICIRTGRAIKLWLLRFPWIYSRRRKHEGRQEVEGQNVDGGGWRESSCVNVELNRTTINHWDSLLPTSPVIEGSPFLLNPSSTRIAKGCLNRVEEIALSSHHIKCRFLEDKA